MEEKDRDAHSVVYRTLIGLRLPYGTESITTAHKSREKEEITIAMAKLALVMGVVNRHSIAWSCIESYLSRGYDCLFTYQNEAHKAKMERLTSAALDNNDTTMKSGKIIGSISCDVVKDLPTLFEQRIPELLELSHDDRKIDCVVHSLAHARNIHRPLSETALADYVDAHHISAFSFLETIRCSRNLVNPLSASYVALSYLGAQRAVHGYGVMGPAKASLEAIVRGVAAENGPHIRCNAVSAGPIRTAAARGIPNFTRIYQHAGETNALRRSVTTNEVAEAVVFLSEATGITGQVVFVDGGYSCLVPIGTP